MVIVSGGGKSDGLAQLSIMGGFDFILPVASGPIGEFLSLVIERGDGIDIYDAPMALRPYKVPCGPRNTSMRWISVSSKSKVLLSR